MPAIPASVFAEQLRELDHEQLVRFVAALWDRSGWDTRIDGPVVVATRTDSTQRLLVLSPSRFPRLRRAPETDGPVDRLVTPRLVEDGTALPRKTPSAPLVDAASLRNRLLYAIDSEHGEQLATEYLGVSPRGQQWQPRDPALVRFGQRVSSAVEPAEKHVSRRAALGTLGVSLLAGSAWVVTNQTRSEPESDEGGVLGNGSVSTPEASVPETASFAFTVQDGEVTITHDGGAVISAGQLLIRSDGLSAPGETRWNEVSPLGREGVVREGDSVTLGAGERFEVAVVLEQADGEAQLADFNRGIPDESEIEFSRPPEAAFSVDYETESERLTVRHREGEEIRAGELYIRGRDFPQAPAYRWSTDPNLERGWPVRPGDSVQLSGVSDSFVIRVVWEGEDGTRRLLGKFNGPGRPRNEALDGIPNELYGPQKRGFTEITGPGAFPTERWRFESDQMFGASTAIQQGIQVVTRSDGTVYGLDAADGVRLWRTTVDGSTGGTPTVADGRVYLREFTRNQSRLLALDLSDGSTLWTNEFPQQQIGQPLFYNDSLFVAATGGPTSTSAVYAIGASDTRANWSSNVDAFAFPAHFAAANGTVYTAPANRIRALDATSGTIEWEFEQPSDVEGNFWGPIVLEDGLIVFLLDDRRTRVYRLHTDGTVRWQTELFRTPSTHPVVGYDRLFVPLEGADLRALSLEDGEEDWVFFTTNRITALTAASDFVYVAEQGTIRAVTPVAGEEDGSNVKPGDAIRSIVATENRLFTVGSNVISFGQISNEE
jgi:outer membrane protein assembly factor BamB